MSGPVVRSPDKNAKNAIVFGHPRVECELVVNPEEDKQRARDADCETCDVYKRVDLIFAEGAQGDPEVIGDHRRLFELLPARIEKVTVAYKKLGQDRSCPVLI